jgi:hypothetical protein
MKAGDICKTGDNRLGRIVKSNGEYFHYLWMLNSTETKFVMEKFYAGEIIPASEPEVLTYKQIAKEFNQRNVNSPR